MPAGAAASAQIPSPAGEDVEMVDVSAAVESAKAQGKASSKGKKKGGKGKR